MKQSVLTPIRAAVAVCVIGCTLAGCGGGGPQASATRLSVSATTAGGLTATLSQDRAFVPVGSSPVFTLTLANSTAAPVTVQTDPLGIGKQTPGTQAPPSADLSIMDGHGNVVWPTVQAGVHASPVEVALASGATVS